MFVRWRINRNFRKNNFEGEDVLFKGVINPDKILITIIPQIELEKNRTYYLSLIRDLSDFANNALVSFEADISTVGTNSNLDFNNGNEILIFPNPVLSRLSVSVFENEKGCCLRLFNSIGNLLQSIRLEKGDLFRELNVSQLNTGFYYVDVEMGNVKITKKIIKL